MDNSIGVILFRVNDKDMVNFNFINKTKENLSGQMEKCIKEILKTNRFMEKVC